MGKQHRDNDYRDWRLYHASLFGYQYWKLTLDYYNAYENDVDTYMRSTISEVAKKGDIEEQKEAILKSLMEEIKIRLQFYNKDEIFVVLLSMKECIRRKLLQRERPDWLIIGDIATINLLMKVTNEIVDFKDHLIAELEIGSSHFAHAIGYARRYNMITENINLTHGKNIKLEDICFEPIETEETETYFDLYLKNGFHKKPEDYKIQSEVFRKKLEKEEKTPDKILKNLNSLIKKEFGFSMEDGRELSKGFIKAEFLEEEAYLSFIKGESGLFQYLPVCIIKKSELNDILQNDSFQGLLETFSINRNHGKHIEELELFCFYEIEDLIVFGNFDLAQTIATFEKFLLSGHYIDIYKSNLSNNKLLKEAQKTLSKYFSASVADYLYSYGYTLPMEKYFGEDVIRAEIDTIPVHGKNILIDDNNKKLGDIDVLALNRESKEVLLFELKFYKPAIVAKDMFLRDRSLIVDKDVLRHIKEREEVILNNIDQVVEFILGKPETGYSVKAILLTARTNFYGIQEKEITYLTWGQFLEKVKRREL